MESAKQHGEAWSAIIDAVKAALTRQQFQTWFRFMRLVRLEDGLLEVDVPNDFLRNWIREYYLDLLARAAEDAVGERVEIVVSVAAADEQPAARTGTRPTRRPRPRAGGASGQPGNGGPDAPQRAPRSNAPPARQSPRRRSPAPGPRANRQPQRATARQPLADTRYQLFGHPRYRNFLSDVLLNENYVFENFVKGPSNHLAHAAAKAVANKPAQAYNPLFLHGAVGLGKSHLLQGITAHILSRRPDTRVIYLSCETFVNQFISAVEAGDLQDFRYRYRHVDMLLIDDIHFLARKERTQEEFFHTFNTLYNLQKQIVLSCDSPPREIPTLQERLVSRFKWGLVAEIEQPDHETRVAIVRRKAEKRGLTLPDAVCELIADNVATNVRELEGAVLRVVGYGSLSGRPITLELAEEALRDVIQPKERKVTVEAILQAVAEQFGVKTSELMGKRRHRSISLPRQVAMYLARRLTAYSLVEIGARIGGRDHTTVIYAVEKIARELEQQPRLKEDLDRIVRRVRTG